MPKEATALPVSPLTVQHHYKEHKGFRVERLEQCGVFQFGTS